MIGRRATGLTVLAIDDELPALEELAYLLGRDERVATVHPAQDAMQAVRMLDKLSVDAVFLDIRMPGLDGLALGRMLSRFAAPPALVFVTAYDDAAVAAFDLDAVDYLLKPVRAERLGEALRRVLAVRGALPEPEAADETLAVELGGTTRFVARSSVLWVEAAGDYARLHTATGSHLVRVPLATLEQRWASAGFVRVHRSHLVALQHVQELRLDPEGHYAVQVGARTLPVARRHSRELKDLLVRRAGH